ncbi:hypothetical protein G6O69_09690 [Pseudenhygromyxa sp. WMMC2535]|uniref:hypothetical protein n=1 Tax=Pseudenhygromyxa sp. WMMC2535 TaxID=2712867 RepID=UPI001553003B|nr:hypothetical protein [Pseudenhygromyxa sp. WMMC2535]NVB38103.1 hypothetical protein [Pseudenhygromyxa sp. WMMC2535]
MSRERDQFWWALLAAALLSRGLWAIWVHPAQDYLYADMAHYVYRARQLVELGVVPGDRSMAWQAWGTHWLLALPMLALGTGAAGLWAANGIWAACSAASVMLGFALARRCLPARWGPWPARVVGLALLAWIPLLSQGGYFLSEVPFCCALLAATLGVVTLAQDGEGAVSAGAWGAVAFALRPQVAVFYLLLIPAHWRLSRREGWRLDRRQRRASSPRLRSGAALRLGIPLGLALLVSMAHFRIYTGRWGGVAESATVNLTAGRCHNVETRAFRSQAAMDRGQREGFEASMGRRISLPGFRALARAGEGHPLALRPALGSERIDYVGEAGDPQIHRALRRRCLAATGLVGQLRYSLSNVALAWVIARPWPQSADHRAPWMLPVAQVGRRIAAGLAPVAVLAMLWALASLWRGRSLALGIVALQLLAMILVSALFFATPRLRAPYDPYALILVVAAVGALVERLRLGTDPRPRCE